jgi:hypothetical protein
MLHLTFKSGAAYPCSIARQLQPSRVDNSTAKQETYPLHRRRGGVSYEVREEGEEIAVPLHAAKCVIARPDPLIAGTKEASEGRWISKLSVAPVVAEEEQSVSLPQSQVQTVLSPSPTDSSSGYWDMPAETAACGNPGERGNKFLIAKWYSVEHFSPLALS